ncbi:hypothetical protein Mal64_30150 [Pseudobythopirellula maris]|uniref:PEP-CTERM protein-sorting domain-containing protein n=2 Tax=Pseudobythopirellula maris TaxID=2527991 RepID=A0A5C5ZJR6_9BACT|nr:hypothetical protein Mal64_30150 [Pseudobythopirellula maris]
MHWLLKSFLLGTVCGLAVTSHAATVEYSLRYEGVDPEDYTVMPPGEYNLQVWAEVTDNDIGGGFNGGLLSYAFQLNTHEDHVLEFVEGMSGFPVNPVPSGRWDSTTPNSLFAITFQGELDSGLGAITGDVFAQTGSMDPGDFDDNFDAIGVGSPTLLVSGPVIYHGGAYLVTVSGLASEHIVYGPTGATPADVVESYAIAVFPPEPTSMMLAALACCGVMGRRQRIS